MGLEAFTIELGQAHDEFTFSRLLKALEKKKAKESVLAACQTTKKIGKQPDAAVSWSI